MRSFRYRRAVGKIKYRLSQKRWGGFLFFCVFCAVLGYVGYCYFFVFQPALIKLGTAHATRMGELAVHEAVGEVFSKEQFLSSRLVSLETSEDGQISAVIPDVGAMNRLKSALSVLVTQKLNQMDDTTVSIPAGTLSGVDFLANFGPHLSVSMFPYGRALVDIESHFSDAGINQTRHQMLLTVDLEVSLLLPDTHSVNATIRTTVPMSETVVVGSVPNSYTNLETEEENVKDDVLNLID